MSGLVTKGLGTGLLVTEGLGPTGSLIGLEGAIFGSAVVVGDLTINPTLRSDVTGSATLTGDLTTRLPIDATNQIQGAAVITGALTAHIFLAGNVVPFTANVHGALTTDIKLAGDIVGHATVSLEPLRGQIISAASVTGSLTTDIKLNASIDYIHSTTDNGGISYYIRPPTVLTGTLILGMPITGAVTAFAAPTGNLTIITNYIFGNATGQGTPAGSITTDIQLNGNQPGASTITGELSFIPRSLDGSIFARSGLSGWLGPLYVATTGLDVNVLIRELMKMDVVFPTHTPYGGMDKFFSAFWTYFEMSHAFNGLTVELIREAAFTAFKVPLFPFKPINQQDFATRLEAALRAVLTASLVPGPLNPSYTGHLLTSASFMPNLLTYLALPQNSKVAVRTAMAHVIHDWVITNQVTNASGSVYLS